MTLLSPLALFGLALLAIPIIVHLFKPRKMRQTPFSSLRWLKQTHQRLSRRIQWHQWLLFFMRAGVITCLVVALARPLLGTGGGRPTDRFVVLDTGRTMAYQQKGQPSLFEQAREEVARLLQQARPGDRTALVLAGAKPRLVGPLAGDGAGHLSALQAARQEFGESQISAALPLVQAILARGKSDQDAEIICFTSNPRSAWRLEDVARLGKDERPTPRVRIIQTAGGSANAWVSSTRLLDFGHPEHRLVRVEMGCVGEKQERTLRLSGIEGLADQTLAVELAPGMVRWVDFKVPRTVTLPGQIARAELEPADALASDDAYFVSLEAPWSLNVLVVEPEALEDNVRGPGLYVRAALASLGETGSHALRIVQRGARAIAAGDLDRADIIFLAGVPELSDAALERLELRVRAGAGVVLFLGEKVNTAFYNEKLHKPLQPGEGLLPAPLAAEGDKWRQGPGGEISAIRWHHPLLAAFQDPVLSDFHKVYFTRSAVLTRKPEPRDLVLARIGAGEPALVERPLGAGRVLFWNSTADAAWSNLPQRSSFVPLVDRTLSYLGIGGVKREFIVGEPLSLPLAKGASEDLPRIVSPGGAVLSPSWPARGNLLWLETLPEPGIFQVVQGDKEHRFCANVSRAASPLARMDGDTLREWCKPANCEIVDLESFSRRLGEEGGGWPLWPLLVFLAGLLLLAETIYVHYLCPRRNPSVVESMVPRQGLLKPVTQKVDA